MEKKSLSKPMKEILTRIEEFEYIKTVIFPEDVIINVSCQCLLSMYITKLNQTVRRLSLSGSVGFEGNFI